MNVIKFPVNKDTENTKRAEIDLMLAEFLTTHHLMTQPELISKAYALAFLIKTSGFQTLEVDQDIWAMSVLIDALAAHNILLVLEEEIPRDTLTEIEKAALALYTPPFRFKRGYIYDSEGHTVSNSDHVKRAISRIRGWGHIQYEKGEFTPEELQDAVGNLVAMAMTEFWWIHGQYEQASE